MKAVAVIPRKPDSIHLAESPKPSLHFTTVCNLPSPPRFIISFHN